MMEINTVVLEDNIRYAVIKELEKDGNTYVYLVNMEDPEDFCIRKVKIENEKKYLAGLDSDEEFELVMLIFAKELNE